MSVPVGMRTVVVSGGASWANDSPRPRRPAAAANDAEVRKSRRWSVCMTVASLVNFWHRERRISTVRNMSALPPEADLPADIVLRCLVPIADMSFDDLVRRHEQRLRNFQTKRPRSPLIYH